MAVFVASMTTLSASYAGLAQGAGVVSGRVTRDAGGSGVANVQVTLIGPMVGQAERALASFPLMAEEIAESLAIARIRSVTDEGGRFTVGQLAPGLYALIFRRDGYFGAAKPGDRPTSSFVTTTVVVTPESLRAETTVALFRGATIRGTVRDSKGIVVPSARVLFAGDTAVGRNVGSGADGTYSMVVAPDTYWALALTKAPSGSRSRKAKS